MVLGDITILLRQIEAGSPEAWSALLPLVYDELRGLAQNRVGGKRDQTLSSTALVHEAYLRLCQKESLSLNDRRHFFAVTALAMRQILVDHARRKQALKRGGDAERVELELNDPGLAPPLDEILFVDASMERLREMSPRAARVVELRYFGGLSVEETGEVLEVDARTVKRDWRKARAILYDLYRRRVVPPREA